MMTVRLPWPPSSLSPNARGHWSIKAKAAAKARRDACIACQASGIRALGWPGMAVSIEFCPPDRRHRDLDNMLSSAKSLADGLADASGVDDSLWSIAIKRGAPVKGGAIVVTVGREDDTWQSIGGVTARLLNEASRKRAQPSAALTTTASCKETRDG